MAKRPSTRQLTKDDPDEGDEEVPQDGPRVWTQASEQQLSTRTFAKVKRRGGGQREPEESEPKGAAPAFNFLTSEQPAAPAGGATGGTAGGFGAFGAAAPNPWAKFQVEGNWECTGCLLSNKKDVVKCISCETPKPGTAEPPSVSFGAPPLAAPAGGAPKASPKAATKPAMEAKEEGKEEADGEDEQDEEEEGKTEAKPDTGFNFSGGTGFSFSTFAANTFAFDGAQLANPFGGLTGDSFGSSSSSITGESHQVGAAPAESHTAGLFKDKTAEPSGEQDEKILAKVHGKAYALKTFVEKSEEANGSGGASAGGEAEGKTVTKFLEAGEGDIHINLSTNKPHKARIVMRADKTQRLVLNTPLYKNMKLEQQGEKYLRYSSTNALLEDEGAPTVFLLKLKAKADSETLHAAITQAINNLE